MTAKPMVSIMMPVYNGADVVMRAVSSILLQTYQNWELIIVNDGSTDNTSLILDKLSDPRIRVFHFPKNKGRPVARQKALDKAKGAYLAMLDADDWYYSTKLERQVAFLEQNPKLILISSGMTISYSRNSLIRSRRNYRDNEIQVCKNATIVDIRKISHATSLIRLDAAKELSYDVRFKVGEDQDFLVRLLLNKNFAISQEILYHYNRGVSFQIKKLISGYQLSKHLWLKHTSKYSKKYLAIVVRSYIKILRVLAYYATGNSDKILKASGDAVNLNDKNRYHKALEQLKKAKILQK